jgi:hypothetical protein
VTRMLAPCSMSAGKTLVRSPCPSGWFAGCAASSRRTPPSCSRSRSRPVSRIERGELKPAGALRNRLLDLVVARLHPSRDAALRRLVEGSASPVHLVCDLTHRLLAASGPREREWQRTASELQGQSLWRNASEGIRSAEARLPDLGWGERDGSHALSFVTEANGSDELRIVQGVLVWERILLSDGSPARVVTSPN